MPPPDLLSFNRYAFEQCNETQYPTYTKCGREPLRLESFTPLYQNKISRPLLNMKIQEQQLAQKGANREAKSHGSTYK
jgi:hypothetical protein